MTHIQTQYDVDKEGLGSEVDKAYRGGNPRTYILEFTARVGPRPCPVEGCSGRVSRRTAMRVHFCHRHVRDTVVILEESNLPHPRLPLCGILVPWKSLNGTHRLTAQCNRGAERKRRRLPVEGDIEITTRDFSAYGCPV